ncbi:MAG TPA: ATP-binding protein [Burkholderiaceae bacterium]
MSLRLKINLIMVAVITLLVASIIALQIDGLRRSVREEVAAANVVAAQLLKRIGWVYAMDGMPTMVQFLQQLGRVRANEITLTDTAGAVLYQSPHSAYKAGREAPAWFQALLLPESSGQIISLPHGQLTIEANPSRAILDGWDDLLRLAAIGAAALLIINLLVFWAMGRALRPFRQILDGLHRLQAGDFAVSLPPLPGQEAGAIGTAFNRMTAVLQENLESRQRAFEAERLLSDSRELSRLIEAHTEAERREIARALHDELGQSVTAIRSLALSVARRCNGQDGETAQAARVISEEAGRLYDHMHGMIPRLAPMALDQLGLADALRDLVDRVEAAHPGAQFVLQISQMPDPLPDAAALAAYRVVQEGMTNALRHGHATTIHITVGGNEDTLDVCVQDNGCGLQHDWRATGHFGLRWLRERVEALDGTLAIDNTPPRGAALRMTLPIGHGT